MFNFTTICESARRHWISIALIALLSLALGVGSSFVKSNGQIDAAPTYTAETVLYMTGYGYDDGTQVKHEGEYNYNYNEGYMMTDVRRVVLSGPVAGAVRASYGEDVIVTAPYAKNEEKDTELTDRFLYIDVTAHDPQVALDAANEAANRTINEAMKFIPLGDLVVTEKACIKTSDGTRAANWGKDKLQNVETPEGMGVAISKKTVVIYLFMGLVLSIGGFAAYDILSRRIRSARDVERLLDLPVLAHYGVAGEKEALASNVRVLLNRNDFNTVSVAALASQEDLDQAVSALKQDGIEVSAATLVATDATASEKVAASDAVLLVVKEALNSGTEIERAMRSLSVAHVPVVGVVFIPKKLR